MCDLCIDSMSQTPHFGENVMIFSAKGRLCLIGLGLFAVLATGWIGMTLTDPRWGGIVQELDVNSGRVRNTRYFLRMQTGEHIEETFVSHFLSKRGRKLGEAEWKYACSEREMGFGKVYGYGSLCGAPTASRTIGALVEIYNLPPTECEKLVNAFFRFVHADDTAGLQDFLSDYRKQVEREMHHRDAATPGGK
jgi:hypothetical protein